MRQVKKIICELCGQEISASNYQRHLRRHEEHPETFKEHKYKLNHEGLTCQFCGKECKNRNSLCNHERLCKENPDKQTITNPGGSKTKGRIPWNKGLTKDTDERVKRLSEILQKKYKSGTWKISNPMDSPESRLKLSESMKAVYSNNPPKISGRCKQGWYKGFYCRSSWELAYLLYAIDNNIEIEPCNKSFVYVFENKEHNYFPDFYLPTIDTYVEIKGYEDKKAKCKKEQFKGNLLYLTYEELAPILTYVKYKYGNDFYKLYE